ncbi:Zinc finger protein 473 [Manis javanica]|nr:Zinc finger protein 473 [Manis javanica]
MQPRTSSECPWQAWIQRAGAEEAESPGHSRVGFCPEDVETASLPAVEFRVFAAAGERALVAVGKHSIQYVLESLPSKQIFKATSPVQVLGLPLCEEQFPLPEGLQVFTCAASSQLLWSYPNHSPRTPVNQNDGPYRPREKRPSASFCHLLSHGWIPACGDHAFGGQPAEMGNCKVFLLPAINSTRTFMDSDDDGTAHLTGRRARSWERRSFCELCQLPSLHFLLR